MKKTILSFVAIAVLLGSAPIAFAATSVPCASPDHSVYNIEGTVVVSCIADTVWQANLAASLSAQNPKLPLIASGVTVTDQFGIPYTCPAWFNYLQCVDATKTPGHISEIKSIGTQLIALYGARAEAVYPLFAKAIASVR